LHDFESPQLFTTHADDFPLSGEALLDLLQTILSKGIPIRFKARGWSMTPFIQDGDVITVAPIKLRKPSVGEVVAFIRPESGNLVVHRVVAMLGDHALIHGDDIPEFPDGIIPLHNILGSVIRNERNNRHIWLGLGPERVLIAWLSRVKLLTPLRVCIAAIRRPFSSREHRT
jgi:signal peptidase I